jgi:hypothetical protein
VFSPNELPQVGDFNGDGYSDTISFNQQGDAIIGINRWPTRDFDLQNWGRVFDYAIKEIPLLGDFNGDGLTDTISFNTSNEAIVGINLYPNGFDFHLQNWGTVFSFGGLEIPSTGDFNGDGRTDTFARRTDGQAIIGLNQGSSFSLHNWGTVGAWGEIPIVGHYNLDRFADSQSFQHPQSGCSHAIVRLGNNGSGFQGLGDWGIVGCWPEIPAGFQAFAYEKRWDRWFGAW